MRKNTRTDRGLVVRPSLGKTTRQSEHPLKIRDRSFYSGPEALGMPEHGIVFTVKLRLGALALLGDRNSLDALLKRIDCDLLEVSLVCREADRIDTEQRAMRSQCGFE